MAAVIEEMRELVKEKRLHLPGWKAGERAKRNQDDRSQPADNDGNLQGGDTAYAQARYIFEKIERALHEAGATLRDVVRTRVFVARLEDWQEVARAHGEVFGDIRPANTLVQVAGLIEGRLVEIEADAVIGSGTTSTR